MDFFQWVLWFDRFRSVFCSRVTDKRIQRIVVWDYKNTSFPLPLWHVSSDLASDLKLFQAKWPKGKVWRKSTISKLIVFFDNYLYSSVCEGKKEEKTVIYAENKKIWSTISKIFVHPKRGSKSDNNSNSMALAAVLYRTLQVFTKF